MSAEKMREEFEVWAAKHKHNLNRDGLVVDYACRYTDLAWNSWQASRAAIDLELPSVSDYFDKSEYPHTCDLLESDLRISIGYHGLKVKS